MERFRAFFTFEIIGLSSGYQAGAIHSTTRQSLTVAFIFINVGDVMQYVDLVAIIAVLQFFFFGVMTGKARGDSGLKAPAVTGHEGFERMYRVQMNTLETLVAFLPSLFIAAHYWSAVMVSSLGLVYIVGRFIYWRAYVSAPEKRGLGFMLSILPTFILIALAIVGIVMSIAGN